jgi:hypothetical protein
MDLFHFFGGDLVVSATGDLLLADQPTTGQQRVYRRLLTNPALKDVSGNTIASGDYVSHPDYGAGLPRKVGDPGDLPGMTAIIQQQMLKEDAIARSPAPQVNLTTFSNGNGISAYIKYVDANTQKPIIVNFDMNK